MPVPRKKSSEKPVTVVKEVEVNRKLQEQEHNAEVTETTSNTIAEPYYPNNHGFEWSTLLTAPFYCLIGFIFFCWFFRKNIGRFIDRTKKVTKNKDGFELNANNEEKEEIKKEATFEEQAEAEDESQSDNTEEVEEGEDSLKEPQTLEDWRFKMIIESLDKSNEEAEKAYEQMKKLNNDPLTQKTDEILYLKFGYRRGKTNATEKLRNYLKDKEVEFEANEALGYCYEHAKDFKQATTYYTTALKLASEENTITNVSQRLADVLYSDGNKKEAINTLVKALSKVQENKEATRIYKKLADIYEKDNDNINRAISLEKAVELQPNDTGLLFKAGYTHSKLEYDDLSLLHYKNVIEIDPEDNMAINNIGVQYDNLSMKVKSIQAYKKAEKLGNTLASANLAYRLMKAGFIEEAQEKLNKVKNNEDVHPNVNAALSDIQKETERENLLEEDRVKRAITTRKLFLDYGKAKFTEANELQNISKEWEGEGIIFTFEVDKDHIKAKWTVKKPSYFENHELEYKYKLEGVIINNSAEITIFCEEWNRSTDKKEYRKKSEGLLLLNPEAETIEIITDIKSLNSKEKRYELKKIKTN